jgi:CRP/FNR family transcriptional regulator
MDWTERFAALANLERGLRARLVNQSRVVTAPAGTVLFGPGKTAESMLLLLAGTVRVQQLSETGREIVLYRVNPGESCVLTTACLMAEEEYTAEGIAETEVTAVAIPRPAFDEALGASAEFRKFVFGAYARRIADLFLTIEDIAFRRVDIRLAEKLLELAREGRVRATHAQLATELGTAREVVSRQLAEFQRRGWVELARGEIAIADAKGLQALAEADAAA